MSSSMAEIQHFSPQFSSVSHIQSTSFMDANVRCTAHCVSLCYSCSPSSSSCATNFRASNRMIDGLVWAMHDAIAHPQLHPFLPWTKIMLSASKTGVKRQRRDERKETHMLACQSISSLNVSGAPYLLIVSN